MSNEINTHFNISKFQNLYLGFFYSNKKWFRFVIILSQESTNNLGTSTLHSRNTLQEIYKFNDPFRSCKMKFNHRLGSNLNMYIMTSWKSGLLKKLKHRLCFKKNFQSSVYSLTKIFPKFGLKNSISCYA